LVFLAIGKTSGASLFEGCYSTIGDSESHVIPVDDLNACINHCPNSMFVAIQWNSCYCLDALPDKNSKETCVGEGQEPKACTACNPLTHSSIYKVKDTCAEIYKGCYRSTESSESHKIPNLDLQACLTICSDSKFAAIRQSQCFCINELPIMEYSKEPLDSFCSTRCVGDGQGKKYCGGGQYGDKSYYAMYRVKDTYTATSRGCYGKYIIGMNPRKTFMKITPQMCCDECGPEKLAFIYGDKCYCPDSTNLPYTGVSPGKCTIQCAGDVTQECGGDYDRSNFYLSYYENF